VLKTIKGDPDAVYLWASWTGTAAVVEEVDKNYNTAGIEVKPDFQEELKFYKFVGNNYQTQRRED
jgi:protein TonB